MIIKLPYAVYTEAIVGLSGAIGALSIVHYWAPTENRAELERRCQNIISELRLAVSDLQQALEHQERL